MYRRDSEPKKGFVYVARHLTDGQPSGYYVIASDVKKSVEQRVKMENAKFPTTELVASFETADAAKAEIEARNRLRDIRLGMIRAFPDKRKPPSNSEWHFNEDNVDEQAILDCVRETCEEYRVN